MKTYHYEIYTRGPDGQPGWDIETGWMLADSYQHAINRLKSLADFDCVIHLYHANMNKDDKITI